MPRATRRSVAAKAAPAGKKCTCNPGWLLIALILLTLGVYSLAAGFTWQFTGYMASPVLLAYFVGILLVMFGKMSKWKSHNACSVHSM